MTIQHPRLKALIFVLLCAAPLLGSALLWYRGETAIPLMAYGVVSVVAFFLYWSDKRKAQTEGWRTPENILHAVELAGGWPGALIAQQVLRHKTRKVSYQVLFWVIVLLHQVFWLDQLFLGGTLLSIL
ncbi:MAG: hypothetical protein A2W79_09115 [Pseudomonadales bacterium RIFCSPLOWO2_12_60_38]|uniref:DUF1294 domain-containing protein n=1 Tax=Pseudomonas TaxID=286 RepID=UPI0003DC19E5|nr:MULTISPECIES: DUF1294 domain-containing protein [unclassified Pseudomonas]ETK42634.1 membrane protein [Pseudomonas fluorescens FH5]OHC33655.1 MAG: hypothetical protein A2W79_09115 [Pseudomonadales bacterium RIFCSPLOWO2_12_60_38]OHC39794.1 MAG: hypothetical protein A3G72_23345 [Pseudomonadales bacterium RIFCSPLOWO2_12_FULL_59_450]PTT10450.1 DUF1294 domain-containing protein [Pseudomonas sp. HMWF034]PVV71276.1 DUF1294 domain-containing protein [Pseudomonas sp. HMWF011]